MRMRELPPLDVHTAMQKSYVLDLHPCKHPPGL